MKQDIVINDQGTIILLVPKTKRGREWLDENVGQENGYQPYWPTVVAEYRYVGAIVDGVLEDGLEVG